MNTFLRIARKEFGSFFSSPIAFIFLGTFLAASLFIFFWVETFFARNIAEIRSLFEWMPILLIFLPTTIIAASAGVWLFYVQHQFEETRWDVVPDWQVHDAALHGSSHYVLPGVLRWFTANIGVHHVHHLYSRIPFYRLPEVLRDHCGEMPVRVDFAPTPRSAPTLPPRRSVPSPSGTPLPEGCSAASPDESGDLTNTSWASFPHLARPCACPWRKETANRSTDLWRSQ